MKSRLYIVKRILKKKQLFEVTVSVNSTTGNVRLSVPSLFKNLLKVLIVIQCYLYDFLLYSKTFNAKVTCLLHKPA